MTKEDVMIFFRCHGERFGCNGHVAGMRMTAAVIVLEQNCRLLRFGHREFSDRFGKK
jgi:hypothetical protein